MRILGVWVPTSYQIPVQFSSQVTKQFYHPESHCDKRSIFLHSETSSELKYMISIRSKVLYNNRWFIRTCTGEIHLFDWINIIIVTSAANLHSGFPNSYTDHKQHDQYDTPPPDFSSITMESWLACFRSLVITLLYPLSLFEDKEDITSQLLSSLSEEVSNTWISLFVHLAHLLNQNYHHLTNKRAWPPQYYIDLLLLEVVFRYPSRRGRMLV